MKIRKYRPKQRKVTKPAKKAASAKSARHAGLRRALMRY